MKVPVMADHVWMALGLCATFSVFWCVERLLFFAGRFRSLRERSRKRCDRELRLLVAQSSGNLHEAWRLASASRAKGLQLRLIRASGGRAEDLEDLVTRELQDIYRFEVFKREAHTIATSLGMLGTVCGMLEAFGAGSLQDSSVAKAISDALGTTALGICIGLPVTYGFGMVFDKWSGLLDEAVTAVVSQFVQPTEAVPLRSSMAEAGPGPATEVSPGSGAGSNAKGTTERVAPTPPSQKGHSHEVVATAIATGK